MRPPYDPWEEGSRPSLLGTFCRGFCDSICSCLYFFSCCWLLQDCLPAIGRPGRYNNPPGSYAPFAPSYDHHHQTLANPLVGPGPAPSRYGPPPPYVPGPLSGPLAEDPLMFEPPGPPLPPGPPRY